MTEHKQSYSIQTPLGLARASYSVNGLCSLEFSDNSVDMGHDAPTLHVELCRQMDAYFNKRLQSFDLPIDPNGTDFQIKAWQLLLDIPYGKTISYQQMAEQYGDIKTIRALAAANGANPIMIITPCHRVIGSDGSLTGYAGGLWRKEALLDLEQGVQRLF